MEARGGGGGLKPPRYPTQEESEYATAYKRPLCRQRRNLACTPVHRSPVVISAATLPVTSAGGPPPTCPEATVPLPLEDWRAQLSLDTDCRKGPLAISGTKSSWPFAANDLTHPRHLSCPWEVGPVR